MKKITWILLWVFLLPLNLFAAVDDTSVLDALSKENTTPLQSDITMKSFDSCNAFETEMEKYYKSYLKNNPQNNYGYLWGPQILEMQASDAVTSPTKEAVDDGWMVWDFSQTNTQVTWVDEADIAKTDGTYIYYYNETEKAVFIADTSRNSEIIKKIQLPKSFYTPVLYVSENRLVIVASAYSTTNYTSFWYYVNRNAKNYSIIFDTSDKKNPELLKLYGSDWYYKESRRIGDMLYVISTNSINFPYYDIKNIDDMSLESEKLLPQKIDITLTDTLSKQNLSIKNNNLPFHVSGWDIADCNKISYSFPDEETLKNTTFNPGYNIISSINIVDVWQNVGTHIIAWNNSELHMSLENLYLTESLYSVNDFSCPVNAMCMRPFFWGGNQNTLIHKFALNLWDIKYKASALIPWSPLNQYSMDEYEWNFRIVTSSWLPERSTSLFVLNQDFKKVSSLENLAPWEAFQSSRFIGDKLFLVTFEQIDPLFAIDISNIGNPKVLWELKIPGYSTYLHPYDSTHLIWLWYDTVQNQWGGTQTNGLKVDLYKINYDKKCWDIWLTPEQVKKCDSWEYKWIIVEQLYTQTLGGNGSYSEALANPRMFVWNAAKKILLLPASLSERNKNYELTDYYNGIFALGINAETWIELLWKNTHINISELEQTREKECSAYSAVSSEPVCRELLNGEVVCSSPTIEQYVPNYCYKDSTIWLYIWDKQWQFQSSQIKRALYIWDKVYWISDSVLWVYDFKLNEKYTVDFK